MNFVELTFVVLAIGNLLAFFFGLYVFRNVDDSPDPEDLEEQYVDDMP